MTSPSKAAGIFCALLIQSAAICSIVEQLLHRYCPVARLTALLVCNYLSLQPATDPK